MLSRLDAIFTDYISAGPSAASWTREQKRFAVGVAAVYATRSSTNFMSAVYTQAYVFLHVHPMPDPPQFAVHILSTRENKSFKPSEGIASVST